MEEDIIEEDVDGSIHSIHVRNFFCHDNLEITMNKNVNFIVGRNGSGKSAILAALVVGLGGRASATNRGSSLNSLIKKGANSATIEIKINNSSEKAYKPNLYGDYITIVRHINASGGSNYKVKSETGEVISTKFEEVNAIILAHDIQVDNPISVLNQDDARSFHASDSKKKYSLFRKATNLDQTETNYIRALENCNKAVNIWNRKNESCIELEKEYKKWKQSHEQLQSKDEIEAKKLALQNEYYWSEIAEFEREATIVQTQYDRQQERINKLAEKLSTINEHFGSNTEVIDALKNRLDENKLEKTALEQELRSLEDEVRETQAAWRTAQHVSSKQAELINRENRKVADIEQEIANIDSGDAAATRACLEARAEEAKLVASAARARYDTARHGADQARAAHERAAAAADLAAGHAHRHRDKLKQLKQELRELESRGSDSLAVFGSRMVELCRRVEDAARRNMFSEPPRGPVGAYLKVKQQEWAGVLEHILGNSIQTFCVNSPEDSRKLFEIMGQVYGGAAKPGVTCSEFGRHTHDVRGRCVRARGHAAALHALDVPDPVIANFLIDNLALERVLLVPTHEEAIRLADTEENVPENCAKIVTLDTTEYHPAPNYRSYGGVARRARYLHLTTAQRKSQVMAEISEAEATLRSLENTEKELRDAAKEARDSEDSARRELQALVGEKHRAEERERAAAAAALEQQNAPHLAMLTEELNVSKEKLRTLKKKLEELSASESQYRTKIDQSDGRIRSVKNKLGAVTTMCRTINEEIEQEQLKNDQAVSERDTCKQKLNQDRSKLEQVAVILEEKRANIEKLIYEAVKLCPRVQNPRERSIVTSELKKTQLKLNSIRSDGMTKAQVAEKLLQVGRKYKRTKDTLDRLKYLIDDIQSTTDKHLNFCHKMQTYIARRVQYCFQSILTLRGYSGRMEIDNGRGMLEITCTGRESGARRVASSTRSLSGGERSYSTVAFIMALWECVELPFYFMDEFDVFMDNVNRKIVMELLIDHALKNKSRQFVFLTPQDTSSVVAGPHISIHMMAAPRP
ncbi:structural maintenance of chromosomes protein 6 [Achroia grisella]|uniref:structural maintenance of chromosomes protein 6 n=1 Tax=Achroia grisella TaxID=688607 RepID=UPI0027D1F137|nr:structural maintenance of chromosomes protein 6 [Achroia grisella]